MKIGIAGAGGIVPTFMEAEQKISELEVTAICGTVRNPAKAEKLAEEYGIRYVYYEYEKMLLQEDIDIIYVAVPNHLHYIFTKQALEAGKHVICEKPFCTNIEETTKLVQLAKDKKLFLFEAICNLYYPNFRKAKELLPALGEIKIVEVNYSQYSSRYDAFKQGITHPVFDQEKSGGSLMDINVYNIHFIVGLFGEPQGIHYFANIEKGIDTSGILIMEYPGFQCALIGAKDCQAPLCVNIQGDKGYIHSNQPASLFGAFECADNHGDSEEYALNREEARLYYELRSFTDMVAAGDRKQNLRELEHSLIVQRILDQARVQAGIMAPGNKSGREKYDNN